MCFSSNAEALLKAFSASPIFPRWTYSGIRAYEGYRQQAAIELRGMKYNAPKPDEVKEDLEFPAFEGCCIRRNRKSQELFDGAQPKLPWIDPTAFKRIAREALDVQT